MENIQDVRSLHRYLLLDPVLHDPLEASRRALQSMQKAMPPEVYLIDDPRVDRAPEARLRLYVVPEGSELDQQIERWMVSEKDRKSICGWLSTHYSLHMLGRHLQRMLIQPVPDGTRMLLRFFDPRVLHHLRQILSSEQLGCLLGPIKSWRYPDINGNWNRLTSSSLGLHQPGLTGEQWRSIERLSAINLCIQAWQHNVKGASLPDDASIKVDHLLEKAFHHDIKEQTEMVAFVLHGLATQPDFDDHPIMQKLLRKRRFEKTGYLALTDALGETDWQAIAGNRLQKDQIV
ncbi:DUF4123 domain-containing protein [Kushneria sp. Sum13]|uniref:DUF4123 domain-containing protein n=1 Tax=Kushneria sp. Sum13 TaxID=3459196 RepID=UPI004045FCF7